MQDKNVRLNASFPLLVALLAASAMAQDFRLPPRAPPDISASVTPEQRKALDEAMRPYVAQAQGTFPSARSRFLAGLQNGQTLFVTARLYDELTRSELAFISVTRIEGGIVQGRVWSELHVVTTHGFRDWYGFPESQLMDWLITYPDGTEEGNALGKFNPQRVREERARAPTA